MSFAVVGKRSDVGGEGIVGIGFDGHGTVVVESGFVDC